MSRKEQQEQLLSGPLSSTEQFRKLFVDDDGKYKKLKLAAFVGGFIALLVGGGLSSSKEIAELGYAFIAAGATLILGTIVGSFLSNCCKRGRRVDVEMMTSDINSVSVPTTTASFTPSSPTVTTSSAPTSTGDIEASIVEAPVR